MIKAQRITPCLWFADNAEDAARLYIGIFKNSRITAITRFNVRTTGSVSVIVSHDL